MIQEEKCLERCVKSMYKTHVKTLEFFQNFEIDYEKEKKALADSIAKQFEEEQEK